MGRRSASREPETGSGRASSCRKVLPLPTVWGMRPRMPGRVSRRGRFLLAGSGRLEGPPSPPDRSCPGGEREGLCTPPSAGHPQPGVDEREAALRLTPTSGMGPRPVIVRREMNWPARLQAASGLVGGSGGGFESDDADLRTPGEKRDGHGPEDHGVGAARLVLARGGLRPHELCGQPPPSSTGGRVARASRSATA
jgi:hypothetical protein